VSDTEETVRKTDDGLPALPENWDSWSPEGRVDWLLARCTKDELYDAIVQVSGISEKTNTAASPFQKHHLAELLLHVRGEDDGE
jgi:hypothetical protein